MEEIPIIQKTYDFIKWYVPILNRLPKNHRFLLGDRIVTGLYDFLEQLIQARFEKKQTRSPRKSQQPARYSPLPNSLAAGFSTNGFTPL